MTRFFKQPLFHFLLAGACIFMAFQFSDQPEPSPENMDRVIEVDRTALLNFMQYRAQAFQPELFSEQLDNMSETEVDGLVADFVREEALHREALAMGMDQGDYIIRQRLVQKVEFLLENLANQALVAGEGEIEAFFEARKADYQVDAVYTFTHIFFDGEERGWEAAQEDASTLANSDQISRVAFNDASGYGDRYPFLQNYVERTRDFVVNNLTESFVSELDRLTPSDDSWYGPFESRYGYHLVMLRSKSDPYVPALDQIIGRVNDDWRYETVLESRRAAEGQVVDGYEVQVNL